MKGFVIALAAVLALGAAVPALAVELGGLEETAQTANIANGPADPGEIAARIISQVLGFIGILFLILMIWGGLLWMTAAGNDEQIKKATSVITAALIGLVIVLSAYAITRFVGQSLLNSTT